MFNYFFRSINKSNKGFKLLSKMGWSEGNSLGKSGEGILEPVSTFKFFYSPYNIINFKRIKTGKYSFLIIKLYERNVVKYEDVILAKWTTIFL